MSDHEQSTTVAAPPEALFDYMADVGNLPRYFPAMRSAETVADEGDHAEVHTVAEVEGTRREGDAWFTAEPDSCSIRWGSEGESGYRGELHVGDANGGSRVTVRLHTEHVDGNPDAEAAVERRLAETLETIRRNVEAGADPAAPSPS